MREEVKARLEKMLESARETHDRFYRNAEPQYEAAPMFFLYKGEELVTMVLVEIPEDAASKAMMTMAVRATADGHECDAFVFNSEGWTIPQESYATRLPEERFSARVDRIEILSMVVGTKEGELASQCAQIERSGDHPKLIWGAPLFSENGDKVKSRFNIYGGPGDIRMEDVATRH